MISSGSLSSATSASIRVDIERDYRELRVLVSAAADCLGVSKDRRPSPPRQIVTTLRRLQHRLAMHFTLEEAFGYGEEELHRAPWLTQAAAELRSEHDALFARLKSIVCTSERLLQNQTDCCVTELSSRFEDFLIDFRRHESRDAELLLSIFDDDLGVGD